MHKLWLLLLALPVGVAAAPTTPTLTEEAMRAAFTQSVQAERQKNLPGAISALTALGAAGERLYLVQLRLGWLMFASGQHDESRRHYEAAIKLAPASIEARLGYGQPLYAQGRYKEIETVAREILQLDRNHYLANLKLATVLRLQKKTGPAEAVLNQMLRYYPCDAGTLNEYILIPGHQPVPLIKYDRDCFDQSSRYEKEQNFTEALKAIEPSFRRNSQDYCANLRAAWLYYLMRDYAKSARCYDSCLRVVPESTEAKLGYALTLLAQQRYQQVEQLMKQVLTLDPLNYYANLRLTTIYRLQKDITHAERIATTLLANYPADTALLTELGLVRAAQGRTLEAKRLFHYVLCLDPDNVTAKQFLTPTGTAPR